MAYIEVTAAEPLANKTVTSDELFKEYRAHLLHYYADNSVTVTSQGVSIDGHLRDAFEWGVVKVSVELVMQDEKLVLSAKGTVTLGKVAWTLFALGLVTGVFLLVYFYAVIMHSKSKDRPEKHLKQALKATAQELNKLAPQLPSTTSIDKTSSNVDALEKLASLKERGLLTDDEFMQEKQQLLKLS